MRIFERNLQEIGKSLFVSLPKEWVNLLNLKKGSRIKLNISDSGSLNIFPEFTKEDLSKEISFDFSENFARNFIRAYFSGNDEITIRLNGSIKDSELNLVHSFLDNFMNVQIVKENKSEIVVKCFKIDNLSVEQCLKRMHYISLDIIEERLSGDKMIKVDELEKSLTKFYFMLVMQVRRFLDEGKFTQENQISLIRALDFRMVGEKIERIADLIKEMDKIKDKEFIDVLNLIKEKYEIAFRVFIKSDYEKSLDLFNGDENMKLDKLEKKAIRSKDLKLSSNVIKVKDFLRYSREIGFLTR